MLKDLLKEVLSVFTFELDVTFRGPMAVLGRALAQILLLLVGNVSTQAEGLLQKGCCLVPTPLQEPPNTRLKPPWPLVGDVTFPASSSDFSTFGIGYILGAAVLDIFICKDGDRLTQGDSLYFEGGGACGEDLEKWSV
jgi:hypothetical protein